MEKTAPFKTLLQHPKGWKSPEVTIERYLWIGPGSPSTKYLRVGLFGGVHGDEPSGTAAVLGFLDLLREDPEIGRGYELFLYPACNPHGLQTSSRWLASGADLNREFWKNSLEPEVKILEQQLKTLCFDGILSFHSDDTHPYVYGFASGHHITHDLLSPALQAASKFLPVSPAEKIDNFQAKNGIITQGYDGILRAPPEQTPKPFEIVLETPGSACPSLQKKAHLAAARSLLENYRGWISQGENL